MKKLSIITSVLLTTSMLNAGLLGFNTAIGGGVFKNDTPKGTYSDGHTSVDLQKKLNLKGDTSYYAWGYVEHPLPIIPNIRLEMNQDKYVGNTFLSQTILGKTFNNTVVTNLNLSSNDVILYWGIPLTGLLSTLTPLVDYDVDFGLGVKNYTGSFDISDTLTHTIDANQDLSKATLGYGYLHARAEAFGVGIEGIFKYSQYAGNTFQNKMIKADYIIPLTPIVDVGVEVGYKQTDLNIDVNDGVFKIKTDLTTSGVFFGGFVKF